MLIALAAQVLGVDAAAAAEPAGIAYGITGLLRSLPLHAARHQLYLPSELLARHGVVRTMYSRGDRLTVLKPRSLNYAIWRDVILPRRMRQYWRCRRRRCRHFFRSRWCDRGSIVWTEATRLRRRTLRHGGGNG